MNDLGLLPGPGRVGCKPQLGTESGGRLAIVIGNGCNVVGEQGVGVEAELRFASVRDAALDS